MKNLKNFSYVLGLFIALGIISTIPWIIGSKSDSGAKIAVLEGQKDENAVLGTVQGICSEGSCVEDTLKQELAQEQDRLIEKIKETYPLTEEKWNNALFQIDLAIAQDTLTTDKPIVKNNPKDPAIIKKAREILASYNIDPARVTIKIINDPKTKTNAASYQGFVDNAVVHDLEINIPRISEHAPEIQEAIIRHEIMHFLNYDPLTRAYIEVMLLENGIKAKEFMKEPAIQNLYKHQEFRADLLAACHGMSTAQALQKDFAHYIKTYPQDQVAENCITHPSDAQRLQAVTQLVGYLEAESKIKLA